MCEPFGSGSSGPVRPAAPTAPSIARRVPVLLACAAGAALAFGAHAEAPAPNPRERIDFWQQNYTAVTAEADPRVAQAQKIFERLVRAAGRRPGVEPRLHVIAEDPANVSLPIAIPDGWIVLSRRVLDTCYRVAARGDDRLAFVLAHEIAHQLEDDFWHMKFFQAIESLNARPGDRKVLTEIQHIAGLTDKVLAKELRADELGMTYAVMSGFDARAILGDAGTGDFFQEWVRALDRARLHASAAARSHPEPRQRAAAIRARLHQVSEQAELFRLGLLFYQAGDFERAVMAFDEFRRYFPGREVQHNLGAAYHQLALRQWRPPADRGQPLFKLSVEVDPLTRAHGGDMRAAPSNVAQSFQRNIAAAIEHYQRAIAQDPDYLPAYRNVASAYVLQGEPYKAIAILQDALKLAPADAATLNNLGVAYYYAKNLDDAKTFLRRAHKRDPAYDAPLFNLAAVLQHEGDTAEAKHHAQLYLARDPASDWAGLMRARFGIAAAGSRAPATMAEPEALLGIEVGAYEHEVPNAWGAPAARTLHIETPLRVARYANGVATVARGEEIRFIEALPEYRGASRRGVRIGTARAEVEARYGAPARTLATTVGESMMYPAHGVTFNLQRGRVVSWVLYWN